MGVLHYKYRLVGGGPTSGKVGMKGAYNEL